MGAGAKLDVGAVIVDHLQPEAAQRAVFHGRHLDVVDAIRAVVIRIADVVDPILDKLDRAADQLGEHPGDDGHPDRPELGAEAPTGVDRAHIQLVAGHLQGIGHHEEEMREGERVAIDGQPAGADVEIGNRTDRFERLPAGAVPAQVVAHHDLGLREVLVDLTKGEGALVGQVGTQRLVYPC